MRIDTMITKDQISSCNSFLSFCTRVLEVPLRYDHQFVNKRMLGQGKLV